jgi:hypothetical protein
MTLWAKSDSSNAAPIHAGVAATNNANGATLFGNTTIGVFTDKQAVGIFGVDTTEQGVVANPRGAHAGWVVVKQGTGPVATITANANAYSPDGNVYLEFTGGGTGNTSANAQIVSNGAGLITGITLTTGGSYLSAPTVGAVPNSNVAITITMGGRAGRKHTETLVAMSSIGQAGVADADDDAVFADS